MKWNEKAAIIGYWRCGMKWEEISTATNYCITSIKDIVYGYLTRKRK